MKIYLDLRRSPLVKVNVILVIKCALLGCTLVPGLKSVSEIASEILPVVMLLNVPYLVVTFIKKFISMRKVWQKKLIKSVVGKSC